MRDRILELKFREHREFCYIRKGVSEYINEALSNLSQSQAILMEVAVNEAINNALKHGTNQKKNANLVTLKLFILNNRQLIMKVRDSGEGFPGNEILEALPIKQCFISEEALKENGRGILIMKSATDKLKYNHKGNEVTLIKNLRH